MHSSWKYRFFSLFFSLNLIVVFQEALRAVEKVNHSDKKTWMAVGNCFFKLPTNAVKDIIKEGKIITPLNRILGEKTRFSTKNLRHNFPGKRIDESARECNKMNILLLNFPPLFLILSLSLCVYDSGCLTEQQKMEGGEAVDKSK